MKQKRTAFAALVVVAVLAALIVVPLASADAPTDTTELRDAVTEDNISKHLKELQKIANRNNGNRASGTPGYDASAAYVASKLAEAGYDVEVQGFDFQGFWPLGPSTLEQTAPGSATYKEDIDYSLMSQTEPDDVSGPVTAVDLQLGLGNASTSGCEMSDFAGFPAGHIALIQRGDCYFWQKAKNAAVAGAVGAIIFNQGNIDNEDRMGLIGGTLTADYDGGISVFETTYARGEEWANTPGLEMHMIADVFRGQVTTSNVLAETSGGRDDRVVMVGAHLDSVPEAPGINDNGSGVAVILEIALQMTELGIEPVNKVRFGFWGAEEDGLIGAEHYVDSLGKDIKDIALNLNFDMVASPNYVRFVYDGDGSDTGTRGTGGSGTIEGVFLDYFATQGLPTAPTELDGASDYQSFMDVGIPVGGLFTGAEGYDDCYHTPCDNLKNINGQALDEMSDAAAHAVLTFAMTKSDVSGTAKASGKGAEYKGPKLQK